MRTSAPFLTAGAFLLTVAGCGGGSGRSAGGTLPDCLHAVGTTVEFDFPAPEGTVFDKRTHELGSTVVEGYVPGELEAVSDYYERELPKSGYELLKGGSEEHEAETNFSGHGVIGHLKLHDIDACDGALTIAVALAGK